MIDQLERTCLFPNCGKPSDAKGYCHGHYTQLIRGQLLRPLLLNKKGSNNPSFRQNHCSFPNCEKRHCSMGYCVGHYSQLRNGKQLSILGLPVHLRQNYKAALGYKKNAKQKETDRQRAIKQWQSPDYIRKVTEARIKAQRLHPNKLEQYLTKLIENNNLPFKFVGNGEIILGRNIPDFININGKKQIIELFGDYWHNIFDVAEKTERYRQYGFSTLVIWQSELKNNPDKVIKKIKAFASSPCEVISRWEKA